ncbi:MAG: hypothetical protein M1343_06955 [Chloroflexi bacterium]|nr:hypothetical protein [Chloroflexota bacterium]MDA8189760.1 hypothetical protein [Dehalococcoidales bacterium]
MARGKSPYNRFFASEMHKLPKGLSQGQINDAAREIGRAWNALQRGETRSNPGGVSKGKLLIGGIAAYVAYRYFKKKSAAATATSAATNSRTGL